MTTTIKELEEAIELARERGAKDSTPVVVESPTWFFPRNINRMGLHRRESHPRGVFVIGVYCPR